MRRRKAVKRKPNLRQVWREKRKSCQEKAVIVKGLKGKQEMLSEVAPSSDRFEEKEKKVVRIKP